MFSLNSSPLFHYNKKPQEVGGIFSYDSKKFYSIAEQQYLLFLCLWVNNVLNKVSFFYEIHQILNVFYVVFIHFFRSLIGCVSFIVALFHTLLLIRLRMNIYRWRGLVIWIYKILISKFLKAMNFQITDGKPER